MSGVMIVCKGHEMENLIPVASELIVTLFGFLEIIN